MILLDQSYIMCAWKNVCHGYDTFPVLHFFHLNATIGYKK